MFRFILELNSYLQSINNHTRQERVLHNNISIKNWKLVNHTMHGEYANTIKAEVRKGERGS